MKPKVQQKTKEAPLFYLCGPMTGLPGYNYDEFNRIATRLRKIGYNVVNPAENFGGSATEERSLYLRAAVAQVAAADGVVVLKGWEDSRGARLEVALAREIGIPVINESTMQTAHAEPIAETVLQEAQRLVHGDRGAAYGHPLDDYSRTAKIWSAIIGAEVTPEQAILCMIGVKLSRECNKHKRDNLTDTCGYAECLSMVHDERLRRQDKTSSKEVPNG